MTALLLAAASLAAPASHAAYAQADRVPTLPGPILLPALEPIPAETLPPTGDAASIGGSPAAPDYWLVSTRRCAQAGQPACPGGTYDYFHVGPDRRPRFVNEAAFRAWLVPGVPVCVVVHGSFTNWIDAVEGGARVYQWIRAAAPERPLQIVFFTWPSDQADLCLLPQITVGVLGVRAEFNGMYLAEFLSRIPPTQPVSLFGHSHGARVVMAALDLRAGGPVQGRRLWMPGDARTFRVVLAAAAIDQHWLSPGGRYDCAMARVERLINLRNRNDIALAFYPLRRVFSGLSLGRSGFRPLDRLRFSQLGWSVAELDLTSLLDTGHLWDNYYRRPEIARAIVPYLYFTGLP
jgi:hypothetical protein